MRHVCCLLVLCLVIASTIHGVNCFKEHDFKKCSSSAFCNRNRGKTGTKYNIKPASIQQKKGIVTATLFNSAEAGAEFSLTLKPYGDIIRLQINESPSKGRYQVPDIVLPELESKQSNWDNVSQKGNEWTGSIGAVNVKLGLSPFRLEVVVDKKTALVLNSRDMFNFEHRREKKEGDPEGWWEESFNGHSDTKPKGPEALSLDISFPGFSHVYGIPERATRLALKPTAGSGITSEPYRLYNLDVFEYVDESPFGLYGSIPYLLAHQLGLTVGVFWLNAAEMYVDIEALKSGTAAQWISESGIVDLFIFSGSNPAAVTQQYADVTGTTAMPQLFSIGYHQCRWNYRDEADVEAVDAGFDTHAIPYDVLWLDIEHTDGKRYMTWDNRYFPSPIRMQEDVASRGRKMVTIVDPHVKRDSNYPIFSEAQQLGYYVKNKDGGEFDGWCWPGSSSYLDVTNPEVRQWWSQQFTLDRYQGSTKHLYIWNDMNEPSVFNGPEITMSKDLKHSGDVEHRDIHNIYGYYYHLATSEGLKHRGQKIHGSDGDRPFVLSRAFYAGTQRVGPIWTGDNAAQWSHLKVSVPMLLTLGLTGLPFSGADVGGFFGNPDAELLTRWYQLGAYYPFFRGHAHLETQRREPWLFGEDTTRRVRDAIRIRYSLLPYMYTLFRHANVSGAPIVRPLWYEFPANKDIFAVDDEFMLGPGLLVKPVSQAGVDHVDVLLPRDAKWYESLSGSVVEKRTWLPGLDQVVRLKLHMEGIPSFYRGGSIIPKRDRPRRSTATMVNDPFTLVIALDHDGKASGDLYLDDGSSFAFQRGIYLHRQFTFDNGVLTNAAFKPPAGVPQGTMNSNLVIERIVIVGLAPDKAYTAVSGGQQYRVERGGVDVRVQAGDGLIIRMPKLAVAEDWQLSISQGKVAAA